MKNQLLRAIGGVSLAILMLATSAQMSVSAQGQSGNEQGLVGSWNVVVSLRDCETGAVLASFPAMNTYNQGGTTQQAALPNPQFRDLPGHGVWRHETGRSYSGAFQFFSLNLDGTFAARVIVRSAISLGRDGNSYTSTDTAEVLDANGNVITRACSTSTATRFE